VALLTRGEGWHNNHHANPVSARHRLGWYEFDPNYYGIWLLEKLGLAKHIRIANLTRRDPGLDWLVVCKLAEVMLDSRSLQALRAPPTPR
jgi:hypothetical protein